MWTTQIQSREILRLCAKRLFFWSGDKTLAVSRRDGNDNWDPVASENKACRLGWLLSDIQGLARGSLRGTTCISNCIYGGEVSTYFPKPLPSTPLPPYPGNYSPKSKWMYVLVLLSIPPTTWNLRASPRDRRLRRSRADAPAKKRNNWAQGKRACLGRPTCRALLTISFV